MFLSRWFRVSNLQTLAAMMIDNASNEAAIRAPTVGDFWLERVFTPYFLVVAKKSDTEFVVLSCLGGRGDRKDEPNARVVERDSWYFDYSKSMVVDLAWMERAVKYGNIDGFCASVRNDQKTRVIVGEWREYVIGEYQSKIQQLELEMEQFSGWSFLKEEA